MRPQPNGQKKILYHYVLVREDLPIGVQAAQIIHAAGESCEGPLPSGTYAVALGCRNEDHLLEKAQLLWDSEIPHKVINEPDEPYHGEAMAIGLFPTTDRDRIKKCTSDLPLLGKPRRPKK